MFIHLALLSMLAIPPSSHPRVEVWTNRGEDPYSAGQAVRVSFQTDQDAYVTVLRVDTDGRVRVLFPREPWEDNFARGGRVYEVQGIASFVGFRADDYPGEGYVFAVASPDPFAYDPIESDQRWNYEMMADGGRIRGDPYAALTELAARIVPPGDGDWDYDISPYYVQQHYDYPRFLCYDCHTYASFRSWNPYNYSCVRFRIVMFDDPYYYPYRSYGGTRVVFRRPLRPEPRFIFKDRRSADAFVTRVRQRPVNDSRRREVGVRGRDIGGRGTLPHPDATAPRDRSRVPGQRTDDRGMNRSRQPERPGHPVRPDRPTPRAGQGQSDRARPSPLAPQRRPDDGRAPPTRRAPAAETARPKETRRSEPSRGGRRDNGRRNEPELRRRK
jgi:Domain of unknown function (DUF4384)